ncbi:venom serine carboxypeptidase-like [Anoplolepis gracilipes]|uniref:venom serine carboxypeptidase-like n=1 Tax=Anoplolepis gracilipes TaxID=354296 RepID=UPI003BA30237
MCTINGILSLGLLFFVLPYESTCGFLDAYPKLKQFSLADGEDVGTPLYLTPLIEGGEIEEARSKALVQDEEMGDVISYSGYFTVNKEYNSNLFFWFFPAMYNPETAPVLLWLQGGPGGSSMVGLFLENGPFIVTPNETLQMREYSWTLTHNVIYIDNPVGTGYSFTENTNGYATNEVDVGRDVLSALIQFFLLFPELQSNDFFVSGESYGGKYVPAVSHAIKDYNVEAEIEINLKGLSIGNGLCDPENQLLYSDYLYQIGLIDLNGKVEFQKYEQQAREFIEQKQFFEAFESWNYLISVLFENLTDFNNVYNYLYSENNLNTDWMSEWIQKADTRKAIHVGNSTFQVEATVVYGYLEDDIMQSIIVILEDLLEHYNVLIYNGQLDIIVAYPLTENYIQKMQWSGADKYNNTARKFWTVGDELAGYTKHVDNLTFALVRNAGHMVPSDQPKWAFDLITRFTHNEEF